MKELRINQAEAKVYWGKAVSRDSLSFCRFICL